MATFQVGDRVRVIRDCPTLKAGDEVVIRSITYNPDGSIRMLIILVSDDGSITHGTSVFPYEVEAATSVDTSTQ